MEYGCSKKKSCCYKCIKRTTWCHADCPDYAEEKEQRIIESMATKKFLYPASSSYFKDPKTTSKSAKQSKKRYR